MSVWRKRIDARFESLGDWIYRHRWLTFIGIALAVAGLASQFPKLRMESSEEAFFHKSDPTLIAYDAFREQFGRDEFVIITITPSEVFDRGFLTKLIAFHNALDTRLPYVKEVTSLYNVRDTRGVGDTLVVEDFLEKFPQSDAALAALRERALASKLYRDFLISEDGKLTAVVIETVAFSPEQGAEDLLAGFEQEAAPGANGAARRLPLTDEQDAELVRAVDAVVAEFEAPDFRIHVAGGPVVGTFFHTQMQKDMGLFTLLCLIAIIVLLFVLFRRLSGVLLPMIVVVLSVVATMGLMALTNTPFTVVTTFLPTFLLACAVGHSVHLLAMFFRRYQQEGDKRAALVFAMGHSGLPIVMTGLTTVAGLFSFAQAQVRMVAELGIFGGLGVLTGLVFTLVLMPALLAVSPLRPKTVLARQHWGERFDRVLIGIADIGVDRAWPIVIFSAAITAISIVGLFWLNFSQNFVEWIPESEPVRQSIDYVDERLKGGSSLELLVDTGKENGLYDPALLDGIDSLTPFSEQFRNYKGMQLVGKTFSVVDVLKETNQALNENRADHYTVPKNRDLVAQEMLLFENSGSDDLEDLVDSQFSKARLSLRVRNDDAHSYVAVVDQLAAEAKRVTGDGAKVTVTGTTALFTAAVYMQMLDMVKSYVIASVAITIMMMLLVGSFRIGVLSMAVNFIPILITLGVVMAIITGIRLDVHNLTIGSIALGLAVDDTIHYFHNFRRYFAQSGDVREAARQTLLSTGRAMLFTTVVLVIGFWLFMGSTLKLNVNFGLLTGLTLVFALLADFFLSTALFTLITRTRHGRTIAERWSAA
jgi:predicted RND superfamily exporter protein